ncbi:hypothetical protein GXW82_16775 [Streptacidiphilus sp. 4-A2]|nr:hypothetical protein [Streptacidiphilus sp. 4-A2]
MTLKSLPLDVERLGAALCVMVAPKVDPDGVQKVDRDGVATWAVSVALTPDDGRAALIEVSVPGEPKGLASGMYVKFTGLSGFFWEMNGRRGWRTGPRGWLRRFVRLARRRTPLRQSLPLRLRLGSRRRRGVGSDGRAVGRVVAGAVVA